MYTYKESENDLDETSRSYKLTAGSYKLEPTLVVFDLTPNTLQYFL